MRRNLLIAERLAELPRPVTVLLIAGARELNTFAVPAGVDCVTLPALRKCGGGIYQARSLQIPVEELVRIRSGMIRAALDNFRPDVLIVDKVPRGVMNELDATLRQLRSRPRFRCVLGLRDVLDDPDAVRHEWSRAGNENVIRDYYDAVWVYGDPAVYDVLSEYRFGAAVAAKLRYTGYLDPAGRVSRENNPDRLTALGLPPGRLVLCQVGGGQDGDRVADAFSQAPLTAGTNGVIVTGPFMSSRARQRIRERVRRHPRLQLLEFVDKPGYLLEGADRVIAMGGYNSLCEILSTGKPALIVPRVVPRCEQLIRAERFRDLGFLDVLRPEMLTPRALANWLGREIEPPRRIRERIDFGGLERLPGLLEELVSHRPWTDGAGARRSTRVRPDLEPVVGL